MKQKFGITYTARKLSPRGIFLEGKERKRYFGILKSPKSEWDSRNEAKKSRAFKRLQKEHRNPRIVKVKGRR